MQRVNYERIKSIIGDVFEENADFLNHIPIDIFGLARKMGFRLLKASDLIKRSKEKLLSHREINKEKVIYGYTFFDKEKMEYVIYYDDIIANKNKQRFSVAHEIGHIVLGHIDGGIQNSNIAEKEADYFAGYVLCPDCLSTNDDICKILFKYPYKIPKWFGVAEDTASIQLRHHSGRNSLQLSNRYEYENIIMGCLEEAVLTKIRD